MSMATAATTFDDPYLNTDDLKMPERAAHRRAVDVIALAATRLLGSEVRIFRDMNWYPIDGGPVTAPDIMVLPATAIEESPRSYRQPAGGPAPGVIVEVPSDSDGFGAFRAKAKRAQSLGSVVYIVVVDDPDQVVLRLGLDDAEPVEWTGRPAPEFGGIIIDVGEEGIVVELPTGERAASDGELLAIFAGRADALADRADALADRADAMAQRADAMAQRADAMADRLRELGIDPDDLGNRSNGS